MSSPAYEQAAWSWTEHLRSGGSTTWADWVASGAGADAKVPPGWVVPGAAQLEFLRRAAAGGVPDGLTELADVVLGRSGPGRGLAQQPLAWPGGGAGPRLFGAPPTDPSDVPVDELVRVGVGALTELLLRPAVGHRERTSVRRRLLTRTPAFALAGAPVTTSAVRRALGAAGHAEGGRSPRVLLFAEPLDRALAQVWSARVQRGAPVRWEGFVERWSHRAALPPSVDVPALARRWADRVGAERVHVVVAPATYDDATRTAAEVIGVRTEPPGALEAVFLHPRWKDLPPAAVDLARRVNAVLNVRAAGPARAAAVARLVLILEAADGPGGTLTIPGRFQDWTRQRARRLAEDLRSGGYSVHGDLDRVVPQFEGLPTRPRRTDVLRVVEDACLGQAMTNVHMSRAEER